MIKDKFIIVDDFLPKDFYQLISSNLDEISWNYNHGTASPIHDDLGNFFFIHDIQYQKFFMFEFKKQIRQKIFDIDFKIVRCNLNLTLLDKSEYQTTAHIDFSYNHHVVLLYMNETDGDTILYDSEWNTDKKELLTNDERDSLPILKRISPKPNRCVVFDGKLYHSYFFPKTHNRRIVVNCDIIWASGEVGESQQTVNLSPMAE